MFRRLVGVTVAARLESRNFLQRTRLVKDHHWLISQKSVSVLGQHGRWSTSGSGVFNKTFYKTYSATNSVTTTLYWNVFEAWPWWGTLCLTNVAMHLWKSFAFIWPPPPPPPSSASRPTMHGPAKSNSECQLKCNEYSRQTWDEGMRKQNKQNLLDSHNGGSSRRSLSYSVQVKCALYLVAAPSLPPNLCRPMKTNRDIILIF